MGYVELTPAALLSMGFAAPRVTDKAWCVRWDAGPVDAEELVRRTLPPATDFHTSGSAGPSRCWRRTRENLWLEAGMLAGLLQPDRPEAVVSFVPPRHLYGALATVLVPAHLRVPVWYRPSFFGAMPTLDRRRIVVVATPWIFKLLLENIGWVRATDRVTVLHSSAMLPATAHDFLVEAGPARARVVEILGSTEAGGIAWRSWCEGDPPPWRLFGDVCFAGAGAATAEPAGGEVPLVISSPRLAHRPDEDPPPLWETDDHVQPLDDRTFRFSGRRSRLVKVNGRRINLDDVEHSLRAVLDCADVAVVPVADPMIGEHVDLLVVLRPGTELADINLAAGFGRMGVRPRSVHVVPHIDRTETGKLRHLQPTLTANTGGAT